MTSLKSLPAELIKRIVVYVSGDVQDLLRCERTCRKLRDAVADDAVWSVPRHAMLRGIHRDDRLPTNRRKACVQWALRKIRHEQKKTDNVFASRLSVCGWRLAVGTIVFGQDHDSLSHRYLGLRLDTLDALLEIVQAFLIRNLEQANLVSIHASTGNDNDYPVLTERDLSLSDTLSSRTGNTLEYFRVPEQLESREFDESIVDKEVQRRIIRAAAFRAGVVVMKDAVFDVSWFAVVKFIRDIVTPIFTKMNHFATTKYHNKRRRLKENESISDVPPFPEFLGFCECGCQQYGITPCPRQLQEEAAKIRPTFDFNAVYGIDAPEATLEAAVDYYKAPDELSSSSEDEGEENTDESSSSDEED
jgi:hypothetical protein